MPGLDIKNIERPDETRKFDNGWVETLTIGPVNFARATFQPGWKWSNDVKPIAGTDSCMVAHNGFVVSGQMHIVMDDGTEREVGPGDLFVCAPGHDAWIVGGEPCVVYDFSAQATETYAKPAG